MLLRNDFVTDPRASKMAKTLADSGYMVTVMSFVNEIPDNYRRDDWLDNKITLFYYKSGVSTAKKAINIHTEVAQPNRSIDRTSIAFLYLLYINLKFILKSIPIMGTVRHCVVHANDLDTLPAAYVLSRLYHAKLVYDAHELFGELYSDYTPTLKKLLFTLERYLVRKCDIVCTVNSAIAEEFHSRYGVSPVVVMNCPLWQSVTLRDPCMNDDPKIVYLGSYQEERCIEEVIRSTHGWSRGTLFLRGYGPLESELRNIAKDYPRCAFLDPVPMNDIVKSLTNFDIGIIPYPPNKNLNNKYSSPNKLFEYMMAGVVPVVPRGSVVLESVVDEIGIPVKFAACDSSSIACAVNRLTHDSNYVNYRKKCLELAKTKYNWGSQMLDLKCEYGELPHQ